MPKSRNNGSHRNKSSIAASSSLSSSSRLSPPPPPANATTSNNNSPRDGRTWMNWQWQSVSDISMSDNDNAAANAADVNFEYSESEDDNNNNVYTTTQPKYATGTSIRQHRAMTQSSRIVRFAAHHSSSLSGDDYSSFGADNDVEEIPLQPGPQTTTKNRTAQSRTTSATKTRHKSSSVPTTTPTGAASDQSSGVRHVWNAVVSNLTQTVTRSSPNPKRSPSRIKHYPHSSNLRGAHTTTTTTIGGGSTNSNGGASDGNKTSNIILEEEEVVHHPDDVLETETSPLLETARTATATAATAAVATAAAADNTVPSVPHSSSRHHHHNHRRPLLREERAIDIASAFLRDCERGRRPSLPADFSSIGDFLLTLRKCKYSVSWQIMTHVACIALFVSSSIESISKRQATVLNVIAIVIFAMDMAMGSELRKAQFDNSDDPLIPLRHSRMEAWTMPMMIMLFLLGLEMILDTTTTTTTTSTVDSIAYTEPLWSGALKPIALFYLSNRAKNALEALNRIFRIVVRVLVMELFLILCFATVACQLYSSYESFQDLSTAFLSLFQLSTTVVNPSLWMPMYSESRSSAFFFVLFVVTSVFYLHSLVLSVVFQTYVQASADIHDRSLTDREDAMRLAFLALESIPDPDEEEQRHAGQLVRMDHVRKTLELLRPHYSTMKINALVEIVDPSNQRRIDYPSFRTKIRQALNASIRSTRTVSTVSIIVETTASAVAVLNCIYVVMYSSLFDPLWFENITFPAGCALTILGASELLARLGHVKLFHFTPITRMNATFDGIAGVAAIISFQGIFNYLTGRPHGLELLLVGRSIDMIRVMRFFPVFRDVVRRSGDVFPALTGPLALVVSSVHLFTYLGMAFWGGAITIGDYSQDGIEPLYDYNNFNTYTEGLVTMFQVLVVNDWHAIAMVFLFATRCSSPYIVYPFFVGANLICVSIMLNCLTAFFVGAFVTKLNDDVDAAANDVVAASGTPRDFTAHSTRAVQRMSSQLSVKSTVEKEGNLEEGTEKLTDDVAAAKSEEMYEFDVYEREGYDKIMRTVAYGNDDDDDEFARQICDVLEVFEGLGPSRDRVGYMVCCQKTLNRYGNRRFASLAKHYVHENALHMVVSDMHAELLLFSSRDRVLLREFRHLHDDHKKLEITASLIRLQPAMSLFVSRVVRIKE